MSLRNLLLRAAHAFGCGSLLLGAMVLVAPASAQVRVYTLDADFNEGALFNINLDTPDQLQVDAGDLSTFPFLWIANAGDDSVSKINTTTIMEEGRYETWWTGDPDNNHITSGPAPSRTAVDSDGNVYVANRGFSTFGYSGEYRYPYVIKILAAGGDDRNGDGIIQTSRDLDNSGSIEPGEMLALLDDGGVNGLGVAGDGIPQLDEFRDERISWVTQIPAQDALGRSLSIDPDGDIWLGTWNNLTYYKLSGATGALLGGPFSVDRRQYGSLVDRNKILWGATSGNGLVKFDTVAETQVGSAFGHAQSSYGIGLTRDPVGGQPVVLLSSNSTAVPYQRFDSATNTFSYPASTGFSSYGISGDGSGNVFITGSSATGFGDGVTKFADDGSIIWSEGAQSASLNTGQNRGAIIDADGNVWAVGTPGRTVGKHRGTDGAALGTIDVGASVYTYSDASGSTFVFTNPFGTWTIVHDTGAAGSDACSISWTSDAPLDSMIEVEVEGSDTADEVGDFNLGSLVAINNGDVAPAGRYILIRVTLTPGQDQGADPVLFDLTVNCPSGPPVCGDLDGDGDVDVADRNLFISSLGTATGDGGFIGEADYDTDGMITYNDYREWYKCYKLYIAGGI